MAGSGSLSKIFYYLPFRSLENNWRMNDLLLIQSMFEMEEPTVHQVNINANQAMAIDQSETRAIRTMKPLNHLSRSWQCVKSRRQRPHRIN